MGDPATDNKQPDPSQSSTESASGTKREINENPAVEKAAEANDAQKAALAPVKTWHIRENLGKAWTYIKSPESTNLIMAGATVVIAIFTALTFWLVWGSGQDTQKLITAAQTQAAAADEISQAADDFTDSAYWMEEHMDDAAKAMQDSVDTADQNTKATIRNAEIAFRSEQRAWIGVQGTTDSKGFTDSEPWKIQVVFFNSGRTPARNVQNSVAYITSPTPLSGPPAISIKQLVFRPVQSVAPQGYYRAILGNEVAAEGATTEERHGQQQMVSEYPLIKNKTLFLYYFGILKYNDGFGKMRETQYCIYLANPDTKEVGMCDAFNDMD